MKNVLLTAVLLLVLLCACAWQQEPPALPEEEAPAAKPIPPVVSEVQPGGEEVFRLPEPDPREQTVEDLLSSMTLEEKVGQMFFVRCPAVDAAEKAGKYHLGGYLLFLRDFKTPSDEWLTEEAFMDHLAAYQDASPIPLLIGVDEEGGTVARASRNPNLFLEKYKSPQELFAAGGMALIEEDALHKHQGLLSYGINVNFAPVADVCTNPEDFMYARSFGQDAAATADYVRTVVSAASVPSLENPDGSVYKAGCVLKHFPGYGGNADTHTGIAIDQRPYGQFVAEDFLPFQAGIDAGAGSILVSHNVVECMDESLPASLSPEVHRILREELGFQGVILTDDLAMDAVEAYAEDGSVAVLAILAGNDMVVTTDFETQIPLAVEAARTGVLPEARIEESVRRVLSWKYDLGLLQ